MELYQIVYHFCLMRYNCCMLKQKYRYTKPFPIELSDKGASEIAACLISICAYPDPIDLKPEGKAQRFCAALLSSCFRNARKHGSKIQLPDWTLSVQHQENTLRQGNLRLSDAWASHMIFNNLMVIRSQKKQLEMGKNIDSILQYNLDFTKVVLNFSNNNELLSRLLQISPESITQCISSHLSAYGGSIKSKDAVGDVRRRKFARYLPIGHIFTQLNESVCRHMIEFNMPIELALDSLILRPEWTKEAVADSQKFAETFLKCARQLGVDWFTSENQLFLSERPQADSV
jgi:hypothetical protein